MAALCRLAPGLAARWTERIFFTPHGPRGSSPRIRAFLAKGRRFSVTVHGEEVAAWSFGEGPPVYLVHGWRGVGGQLAAFADPLLQRGLRVVTFDAPAHGASGGTRASLVHFARALKAVAAEAGEPHAVIAHSLGAAATVWATRDGFAARRLVFVGPTRGPQDWALRLQDALAVTPAVMERMRLRSEGWLGTRWSDIDIPALARSQRSPLMVFHDKEDADVPWSDGAAIAAAWPGAALVTTTGLGHNRILRDPAVVERAVAFVQ
jgi:pimeloyl-ACP methyl ester carboxylesterase